MDPALLWAITGLVLVIVELLTGTFYLLMLGIAAFGAAGTAWLGYELPAQALVVAAIAAVGCYAVHLYRQRSRSGQMAPIDAGMPASFEAWIDRRTCLARVRYRGASWDARIEETDAGALQPGTTVYVLATDGNTLRVVKNRPA